MVTHETDIAQFAKTNILFRDGRVVKNTDVATIKNATKELADLPVIDEKEILT